MAKPVENFYIHYRPGKENKVILPWVDYEARNGKDFYHLTTEELSQVIHEETFSLNSNGAKAMNERVALVANPMFYSQHHVTIYPNGSQEIPTNLSQLDPVEAREVYFRLGRAVEFAKLQEAQLIVQGPNNGSLKSMQAWEHFQSFYFLDGETEGPYNTIQMFNSDFYQKYKNPRKVGPEMGRTLLGNDFGQAVVTRLLEDFNYNGFCLTHLLPDQAVVWTDGRLELPLKPDTDSTKALQDPRCQEFIRELGKGTTKIFFSLNPNLRDWQRAGAIFFKEVRTVRDDANGENGPIYDGSLNIGVAVRMEETKPPTLGASEFAGVIQLTDGNRGASHIKRVSNAYIAGTQPIVDYIMSD